MPFTLNADMVPYCTVALRGLDKSGWRMLSLDCEPEDIATRLAQQGLGGAGHRLVRHIYVPRGSDGNLGATRGWRAGWDEISGTDLWLPIDEPLPPSLGTPVPAPVTLTLGQILYGSIYFTVRLGAQQIELVVDDIEDSLILFARFVRILTQGGTPHAWLANSACAHFKAIDAGGGACRLQIRLIGYQREEMIDVITDKASLAAAFRGLARAIADHPCFAHMWLCHCCLPNEDYERVSDTAEADWKQGVGEGRYPDDWEAEQLFTAERITAGIPLSEELSQFAAKYRQMLRTLEIPPGWQDGAG